MQQNVIKKTLIHRPVRIKNLPKLSVYRLYKTLGMKKKVVLESGESDRGYSELFLRAQHRDYSSKDESTTMGYIKPGVLCG